MAKKEEKQEEVVEEPTTNAEADQQAADEGAVWGLSLNHYEQRTEGDLEFEGFSKSDIGRVKRVMKLAGKSLSSKPFHKKEETEKKVEG